MSETLPTGQTCFKRTTTSTKVVDDRLHDYLGLVLLRKLRVVRRPALVSDGPSRQISRDRYGPNVRGIGASFPAASRAAAAESYDVGNALGLKRLVTWRRAA